jgi:hypothetical protein
MPDHSEAVTNARRQAVVTHAVSLLKAQFDAESMRKRANDKDDPLEPEQADAHDKVVDERRKSLNRLARMHGTTPAKALSTAAEAWANELRGLLESWEVELQVSEDMLAHPDAYGGCLLDGRPFDDTIQTPAGEISIKAQMESQLPGLRAVIAHAREVLGVEAPKPNRATRRAAARSKS